MPALLENHIIIANIIFILAVIIGIAISIYQAKNYFLPINTLLVYSMAAIPLATVFALLYTNGAWSVFISQTFNMNLGNGGGLYGALIGVIIAALITGRIKNVPPSKILDTIAPGLALAIAVGRLGDFFNGSNYGMVAASSGLRFFPLSVYTPELNNWLYAVFIYEGLFCLAIFIFLLWRGDRFKASGDSFLWLLTLYSAGRIVFESMRADSLSIGFVKVSQIAAVLVLLTILILFSRRAVKRRGLGIADLFSYLFTLLFLGAAFLAEFYMGRATYIQNTLILAGSVLFMLIICTRFYLSQRHADR